MGPKWEINISFEWRSFPYLLASVRLLHTGIFVQNFFHSTYSLRSVQILRVRPVLELKKWCQVGQVSSCVYNNIYFRERQEMIQQWIRGWNHEVFSFVVVRSLRWLGLFLSLVYFKGSLAEESWMLTPHTPTANRPWARHNFIPEGVFWVSRTAKKFKSLEFVKQNLSKLQIFPSATPND